MSENQTTTPKKIKKMLNFDEKRIEIEKKKEEEKENEE